MLRGVLAQAVVVLLLAFVCLHNTLQIQQCSTIIGNYAETAGAAGEGGGLLVRLLNRTAAGSGNKHQRDNDHNSNKKNATTTHQQQEMVAVRKAAGTAGPQLPLSPPPLPSAITTTQPPAAAPAAPAPPNYDIVFLIVTGQRPNDALYILRTLRALLKQGVPADSILINNYSGKSFTKLYEHFGDNNNNSKDNDDRKKKGNNKSNARTAAEAPAPQRPRIITRPDPPPPLHPPFRYRLPERTRPLFKQAEKDDRDRQVWRIRQAQDVMHVMQVGLQMFSETQWFVFMEDDAVCNRAERTKQSTMLQILRQFIASAKVPEATTVNASTATAAATAASNASVVNATYGLTEKSHARLYDEGLVAIMLHRVLVEGFLGFAAARYDAVPVDWLMGMFLQNMGLDIKKSPRLRLCSHKGKISSFAKNKRRIVD